jgi:hypothetical protein
MRRPSARIAAAMLLATAAQAQPTREKIIIDTDIGDDIDDAFLHFHVKRVTSVAVSKLATSPISGSEQASKPERHSNQ